MKYNLQITTKSDGRTSFTIRDASAAEFVAKYFSHKMQFAATTDLIAEDASNKELERVMLQKKEGLRRIITIATILKHLSNKDRDL